MELEQQFISDFIDDLNADRVAMPSLPEVALRVRKVAESPDSTTAQLERVIALDPAISVLLLKIANSPAYRGQSPISDLKVAITRLGVALIRNLVTSLTVVQLYQNKSLKAIKRPLQALWSHSTRVAAFSQVFARRFTSFKPDQALLAGLVHDIGVLPVLQHLAKHPELMTDAARMRRILHELHSVIGPALLNQWGFQQEIVAAARDHENIYMEHDELVSLTDVVIVANLHSHIATAHPLAKVDWERVPAFDKLRISPDESLAAMEEAQEEIKDIQRVLSSP